MARYADAVLDIVRTGGRHMTAEQIFLLMKKKYPGVVLATIYNNLHALEREGKIRKICVEGFPDRYDVAARHDHLVCARCGKLMDILLPDMTEYLKEQTGVPAFAYDLKIFYLCEDCRSGQE